MCLFIVAVMLLLWFYLSGSIEHYQLIASFDNTTHTLAQSWEVLSILWPALVFMFLAGVLFVILIMKFIKTNP